MQTITIAGQQVKLDDDIAELFSSGYLPLRIQTKRGIPYVYTGFTGLHRIILKCESGDGWSVDHINRDTLDNRRENLRKCTIAQNLMNRKFHNKTGYKGVRIDEHRKTDLPYSAVVRHQGKIFYVGQYATAEEAARAYDRKASELQGEFACLNFAIAA